jgi:hypothetical protein
MKPSVIKMELNPTPAAFPLGFEAIDSTADDLDRRPSAAFLIRFVEFQSSAR